MLYPKSVDKLKYPILVKFNLQTLNAIYVFWFKMDSSPFIMSLKNIS